MIRRALPVAAAALSLALVPATASATPPQAPVESLQGESYYAIVEDVVLPNGMHATAYVSKGRSSNQREGWGSLQLDVATTYDCGDQVCSSHSYGFQELTAEQVQFDRSLRTA